MLIKKGTLEKYKDLIRFLTGEDVGKMFESHGLIATNSKVSNQFPCNKLNWIGWDFLQNNDLKSMKEQIRKLL
jgi:hypothetical protein